MATFSSRVLWRRSVVDSLVQQRGKIAIGEPSLPEQIRHVLTVVAVLDVSFALLTRLRSEVIAFALSEIDQEGR